MQSDSTNQAKKHQQFIACIISGKISCPEYENYGFIVAIITSFILSENPNRIQKNKRERKNITLFPGSANAFQKHTHTELHLHTHTPHTRVGLIIKVFNCIYILKFYHPHTSARHRRSDRAAKVRQF